MTPAHSAAASAAEEKVSGNYSFGNVNWGNQQSYNASSFKRHAAPVLSTGSFTEDTGKGGVTYSSDGEVFYRQSKSDLRTSIQKSDSFTTAMQEAHQEAQTFTDTESENYAKSINSFASSSASFVEHFAKNYQDQEGFNTQTASTDLKAIQDMGNLSEKFGERYGIDRRTSAELLSAASATTGGGLNFFGLMKINGDLSGRISGSRGASRSEIVDAANDFVHTEQFQEQWQQYTNTAAQWNHQELSDEGARYHEDMQSSYQQVENAQESYQKALTNMQQVSETHSLTKSNNVAVQHALDHSFVQWVTEKEHSFDKGREILDRNDTDPEKGRLIQEFVRSDALQSFHLDRPTQSLPRTDLSNRYQETAIHSPEQKTHKNRQEHLLQEGEAKTQHRSGDSKNSYQSAQQEVKEKLQTESESFPLSKEMVLNKGKNIHTNATQEIDKWTITKAFEATRKGKWQEKTEQGGQVFGNKKFGAKELLENLLKTKKES